MDRLLISSGWAVVGASVMLAAVASESQSPVHPCAVIRDATDRLACYDKAFGRPAEAEAVLTAAAAQDTQDFGFSEAEKRARAPDPDKRIASEQIEAMVTAISHKGTGEKILTLDNGQIWVQAESATSGRLRVGDKVTIRKAALGSYQLLTPGRIAVRVRRIS